MQQKYFIGTSGGSYKSWKGDFYPVGLKEREFLSWMSGHTNATEINTSFYHLPRKETIINWTNTVGKDFRFCPKLSRYISHYKKLQNSDDGLATFFEVFNCMKQKMGPVLIQLPYFVKFEIEKIEPFYVLLNHKYKEYEFALEGRDISWYSEQSLDLMRKYNIIHVISQSGGEFPFLRLLRVK